MTKPSNKYRLALFAVLFGLSTAASALTEFSRGNVGPQTLVDDGANGCPKSIGEVQVTLNIGGKDYITNIDFYDYESVVAAVAQLQQSALADGFNGADLEKVVLAQLAAEAKKLAVDGDFFVDVTIDNIDYPTLDHVCERDYPGLNPARSSEMQTNNPALVQQLQEIASPR